LAWTKQGHLWVDCGNDQTAYLAVEPGSPGAKPVTVRAQELIRLQVVDAVVKTACLYLQQDRSQRQLLFVAQGVLALYEKMVGEAFADGPPELACRKGCSFCCHLDVHLTQPEALLLKDHLRRTLTPEQLEELKQAAVRHREARSKMQPGTAPVDRPSCPLLVDGACSAYEVRPLHCRGANSKDARQCESGGRIDVHPTPLVLANSIACGADVALQLLELDSGMLRLPDVLAKLKPGA